MTERDYLENPGFNVPWEAEESHRYLVVPLEDGRPPFFTQAGIIHAPPRWTPWCIVDEESGWDHPEVHLRSREQFPERVCEGERSAMLFTFFRRHDAGFQQTLRVPAGTLIRLTARAHAWSNHLDGEHPDDPRWSEGAGYGAGFLSAGLAPNDEWANFTFWVGIDPTGGNDPLSDSVVWGHGAHIYNEFADVPPVEVMAGDSPITVFLRSRTAYPFKHNDAYWDDAHLLEVPVEPEIEGGSTKLGAHVLRTAADLGGYIDAGPAVVKFVGDWGMAEQVPEGVLVVGRKHMSEYDAQQQRASGQGPDDAARQFIEDQRGVYQSNPGIKYWEGHNEPVWNSVEDMTWYARFEIERMRLMADLGLKCVIGNFATGTPALNLWPAFVPACRVGKQRGALLGLHEYSCPWMWWMTGAYQIDPTEDEGDEGWTTLRYRKVYRQHLIPSDAVIPLVITECGIDGLVRPLPPGVDGGAWSDLGDFWRDHDQEPDKEDYYFRQLVWYDRELQKDEYVVGATVFAWGNFGPPWDAFDIAGTGVSEKLTQYTIEHPAEGFDPGGSGRGTPRIQYNRTYVLLPPDCGAEWAAAVIAATWEEHRFTIGGSADDAGIGDLDYRRVVAVNPEQWRSDLEGFYQRHYPKVIFRPITAESPEELGVALRALE